MVVNAKSALPTAEIAKMRGSCLTASHSTPSPRRITRAGTGWGTVIQVLSSSDRHAVSW